MARSVPSRHLRRPALVAAVTSAAVTAGVVLAMTGVSGVPFSDRRTVDSVSGSDFFGRQVTWAQGSTLHRGDEEFDVAPLVVRALLPTRHGVFLRVSDSRGFDAPTRWVFFDGTATVPVPGDVADVAVSPDGEHAGWVDQDGPWRLAGRVAKVVVVDLRTGGTEFTTSSGMGGGFGDDLGSRYENVPPTFLGFDEDSAYWINATGSGERWRWHRSTGETERAEDSDPYAEAATAPAEAPWDRQRGPEVWLEHGRPVPHPSRTGERGFLSPDGRFVVADPTAHLVVTDSTDGRRLDVDLGRVARFGGWQGDDRFYALTRLQDEDGQHSAARDGAGALLVSCALPTGRCAPVVEVTGARSVVLPGSADRDLSF